MLRIFSNPSLLLAACVLFATGCIQKEKVDAIYYNGRVYTVNSSFSIAEAFAVKDGKFVEVGNSAPIRAKYEADSLINLHGDAVFPGFIDAHCHFYNYGLGLQEVNLTGSNSFDELIKRLLIFKHDPENTWIIGRGWDQNLWRGKQFPNKDTLDKLFPNKPVILTRIDGHAALVNSAALKIAGIKAGQRIQGGVFEAINGKLTGILVDNAIDAVVKFIPKPTVSAIKKALLNAQTNCFAVGLTTVDDAGLDTRIVKIIDSLQQENILKMRVYAMLSPTPENMSTYVRKGIYKTEHLNVRSVKIYADGALGSRGACLLHDYSDKPGNKGFLLADQQYFENMADSLFLFGYQMNTHCIGDSANRIILKGYGKVLKEGNNLRWRIEHAQVVNKNDFNFFGKFNIIPSIQTTHATSDMYWADERLGKDRIKGAYAYKELLNQNGMLANGSDFPVESINPLYGFYAAISRKDNKQFPKNGFQKENALSREEALKSMTIWAAYANFEEKEKGSIEAGKFADFVILEKDIMKINEHKTRDVKVLATYLGGERVY